MDMQMIKDEVLLKLTGDVVSMELSDPTLTKVINSALREVQRYIDTFKMVTVPYKSCIDVSEYNVSAITGVRRSQGYINNDAQNATSMDPMYASQWMMLSGEFQLVLAENKKRKSTDFLWGALWDSNP